MKRIPVLAMIAVFAGVAQTANAQISALPDTSKMAYNEISTKMKVYVFPAKGQSQSQQKKDEFECYKWAMDQSGVDPLNPPKVKPDSVDTRPDGTAARSATRGALVGLAIGSVSGNAGEGAANDIPLYIAGRSKGGVRVLLARENTLKRSNGSKIGDRPIIGSNPRPLSRSRWRGPESSPQRHRPRRRCPFIRAGVT